MALAAALGADLCEIYTDVSGVFTADPGLCRARPDAQRISFDEMLEIAASGGRVLSSARSSSPGTTTCRSTCVPASRGSPEPINEEDPSMEQPIVSR